MNLKTKIAQEFGEKIRIRACGILITDNKILLAKHKGLGSTGTFWCPPGGAVEFGEKLEDAVKREFREEVNIEVQVVQFLGIHQHVDPPLHALEIFYEVKTGNTEIKTGSDPDSKIQTIEEVSFLTPVQLNSIIPEEKHPILYGIADLITVDNLNFL